MKRVSRLQIIVVHLGLLLVTAMVLYPVLWVIKMALDPSQSFSMGLSPIPETVSLDNFRNVIGTTDSQGWLFGRQLFNSVVVSSFTAFLGLLFSTTAAYGLSRWQFPGKDRTISAFLIT